jgi:hypothetical protein
MLRLPARGGALQKVVSVKGSRGISARVAQAGIFIEKRAIISSGATTRAELERNALEKVP